MCILIIEAAASSTDFLVTSIKGHLYFLKVFFAFSISFVMFSIFSIFDIEIRGQIALYLLVGGAYLSHRHEKNEEERIEVVMKQNERLDALELQQHKQGDANRRIAKLEDEIVSLEDDMIDVMKCESLKDDLFDALLKRDEKRHKEVQEFLQILAGEKLISLYSLTPTSFGISEKSTYAI